MIKTIHQIYISEDNRLPKTVEKKSIEKKELYPDYEYILWNNDSLRSMILDNFGDYTVKMYDRLNSFAYKADLGRLCYLFVYGGIHFDIGIDVVNKFEFNSDFIFSYNKQRQFVETNFLCANTKRNPFLKLVINDVLNRINKRFYGENPLAPTGIIPISERYNKLTNKKRFKELEIAWLYDNSKFTLVNNTVFYYFKKDHDSGNLTQLGCSGTNNYNDLWYSKKCYNH